MRTSFVMELQMHPSDCNPNCNVFLNHSSSFSVDTLANSNSTKNVQYTATVMLVWEWWWMWFWEKPVQLFRYEDVLILCKMKSLHTELESILLSLKQTFFQNYLLNWQTQYVSFMAQFKQDQKITNSQLTTISTVSKIRSHDVPLEG